MCVAVGDSGATAVCAVLGVITVHLMNFMMHSCGVVVLTLVVLM